MGARALASQLGSDGGWNRFWWRRGERCRALLAAASEMCGERWKRRGEGFGGGGWRWCDVVSGSGCGWCDRKGEGEGVSCAREREAGGNGERERDGERCG